MRAVLLVAMSGAAVGQLGDGLGEQQQQVAAGGGVGHGGQHQARDGVVWQRGDERLADRQRVGLGEGAVDAHVSAMQTRATAAMASGRAVSSQDGLSAGVGGGSGRRRRTVRLNTDGLHRVWRWAKAYQSWLELCQALFDTLLRLLERAGATGN